MKESIGSYFALELHKQTDVIYHPDCNFLNTGRNALEYILKALKIEKIFIPYLGCDAILSPIKRLNVSYEYYSINEFQEPIFDYRSLSSNDYFLYINYLGLRDSVALKLFGVVKNLIVDNTQAFFSDPLFGVPTFYSTRKFFGVADGALLCNVQEKLELVQDKSADRMKHLLLRLENPVEYAYILYAQNEALLDKLPLMEMSEITKSILLSIDFDLHKQARNSNFEFLSQNLGKVNRNIFCQPINGPLAYPLWITNGEEVREVLVKNRIYTPKYWPNVLGTVPKDSIEYDMVQNIIPIPVDSRYSPKQLSRVIDLILKYV